MARIALALGSGGARGYAHIGVIDVLERRGHRIVAVAGSSMGALVGGAFAAGQLEAFTVWVRGLSRSGVFRQLDPSLTSTGVLRAERVLTRMAHFVGGRRIEDLPVRFTAVAVDLLAGREVWLDSGPLDRAIRASIGIPGLFTPTSVDGRLFVDGGVLDPLPVAVVAEDDADAVVGVSLHGPEAALPAPLPVQRQSDRRPPPEWWRRLRAEEDNGGGGGDGVPKISLPEVLRLSLAAAEGQLERHILATHPPDLLISIPGSACRTADFHRAADMIDLGARVTEEALERSPLAVGP